MMGRAQAPGMLLLRDLRNLYLSAQEAELAWVILVQVAKAARDPALLEVAMSCCEDAEISRQVATYSNQRSGAASPRRRLKQRYRAHRELVAHVRRFDGSRAPGAVRQTSRGEDQPAVA